MHLENTIIPAPRPIHFDGLLGQEDEWDDVEDGKLEPPTPKDDRDPANLDEAPTYEQPAEDRAPTQPASQPASADELRRMEEKFTRTINIDKPLN